MNKDKQKSEKQHSELWALYTKADEIDKRHFAEIRSNILLHSGEHYARQGSKFWNHVRSQEKLDNATKIRITKNHIQRINKLYINNILNLAPGVAVMPKNKSELQDQKSAELNHSVWQDLKSRHKLPARIREYCADFVVQGEVAAKVFWNPNKGELVSYNQAIDKNTGEPLWDEDPVSDPVTGAVVTPGIPKPGTPNFRGDLEYGRIFAFNLLRDPGSRSMRDAKWLGIRSMQDIALLKAMVGSDDEKLKMITEGTDQTYDVFDPISGKYVESKNQCLFFEMYYKPCIEYPTGYFYHMTPTGILFEGELPFGIFPIVYQGFDELASTPRHYAITKVARPYQAEVNRCASKIIEHQLSLGDDKVLIQSGTKLTQGGILPGVRALQYAGDAPTILNGRDGSQYLNYLQSQIAEMYVACNIAEDQEEKGGAQLDAQSMLYRSMRDKKRYSTYAEKFEQFLMELCEISLEICKAYYPDDMIIPAIGRSEQVNIPEFKSSTKLCYSIQLEPQTEDVESKMGKMLQIQSLLQYVGSNLEKEQIGQLMRVMPYVNEEQLFSDLTMDYDNATNDILALDRGQYPQARPYDKHEYHIQRLTSRMSKPDFIFMGTQIAQLYEKKKAEHEQVKTQQMQALQQAESEFIPSGGALVPCDYYVQDPSSPMKTQRARLPYESLFWLMKKLEQQGQSQQAMSQMNQGAQAEIASGIQPQGMGNSGANPQGGGEPITQPYLTDGTGAPRM